MTIRNKKRNLWLNAFLFLKEKNYSTVRVYGNWIYKGSSYLQLSSSIPGTSVSTLTHEKLKPSSSSLETIRGQLQKCNQKQFVHERTICRSQHNYGPISKLFVARQLFWGRIGCQIKSFLENIEFFCNIVSHTKNFRNRVKHSIHYLR